MVLAAALVILGLLMVNGKLHWAEDLFAPVLDQLRTTALFTTGEQTTTQSPVTQPAQLSRAGSMRYHYGKLSPPQKTAYDAICAQLPSFPESVEVRDITTPQLSEVFSAVMLDQPLFFHISSTHYKTRTQGGQLIAFLPEYRMDRQEYTARCNELVAVLESIPMPAQGEFERELAAHDYLVRNCAYTLTDSDGEKNTVYGALVKGSAACEGYSRAMLLMLELLGMEAYIVTGNASNSSGFSGGHAWNKVRVAGEWYYLDATWDAPVIEDGKKGSISHAYFNITEQELSNTHEITDRSNQCTATTQNYFVRKGLYFSYIDSTAETALAAALRDSLTTGDNVLELKLSSAAAMESAVNTLFEDQRIYRILTNADLSGTLMKTDTLYRSELQHLRVIRVLPVML